MGNACNMHGGDNECIHDFGGEVKKMDQLRTRSMNRC